MNKLTKPNLHSKLPLKNPRKTQRAGDVGWMVDCEIAELTKLANLGHYPAKYPDPVGLVRINVREKLLWAS